MMSDAGQLAVRHHTIASGSSGAVAKPQISEAEVAFFVEALRQAAYA